MKQCFHCGQTLEDSVKFCPNCGTQLGQAPAANSFAQEKPPGPHEIPYGQYSAPPYRDGGGQSCNQPQFYEPQPPYAPPAAPTNGKATASLILGIMSIVGVVFPFVPLSHFIMPVLAIIFGVMGRKECPEGHPKRGTATTGMVLGIVKLLLIAILVILLITAFGTIVALLSNFPFMEEVFDALSDVFSDLF